MKEALCKEFCDQIRIQTVPAGLAVGTSFIGQDGDPIGFYIVGPNSNGLFRIEDSGATVPILEANGADLGVETRAKAFQEMIVECGVEYDSEQGELKTPMMKEEAIPKAALRFLALLLRLQDLMLLTKDRAESTFREEALRDLESAIGGSAKISVNDVLSDELPDFRADVVIRAKNRAPVAVFFVMADAKLYEAMLLQAEADMKAHLDCHVIALMERESSVSKRVFKQALNRVIPLDYRDDRKAAIARIAKESIGQPRLH